VGQVTNVEEDSDDSRSYSRVQKIAADILVAADSLDDKAKHLLKLSLELKERLPALPADRRGPALKVVVGYARLAKAMLQGSRRSGHIRRLIDEIIKPPLIEPPSVRSAPQKRPSHDVDDFLRELTGDSVDDL
jgi:hypothetical protein